MAGSNKPTSDDKIDFAREEGLKNDLASMRRPKLSPLKLQILRGNYEGKSAKEIARMTGVSIHTVRKYIQERIPQDFRDYPEIQSGSYPPKMALARIAPRYFAQEAAESTVESSEQISQDKNKPASKEELKNNLASIWETAKSLHEDFMNAPHLAIERGERTVDDLDLLLRRCSTAEDRRPLLESLSNILLELACAYSLGRLPNEAWSPIQTIVRRQQAIIKELGQDGRAARGRAYFSKADAYYESENYLKARLHFSKAFELADDEDWRALASRHILITSGYLGDKKTFDEEKVRIERFLDAGRLPATAKIELLEGLACGYGLLRQFSEASDQFQEARKLTAQLLERGENVTIRWLQLVRSELIVQGQSQDGIDAALIEKGKLAIVFARATGYWLYAEQIQKLLPVKVSLNTFFYSSTLLK